MFIQSKSTVLLIVCEFETINVKFVSSAIFSSLLFVISIFKSSHIFVVLICFFCINPENVQFIIVKFHWKLLNQKVNSSPEIMFFCILSNNLIVSKLIARSAENYFLHTST